MQFSYQPKHPESYGYLSRIELSLTNHAFFNFFVVLVNPGFHVIDIVSHGPQLQGIEDLRDLKLRFGSPDDGYAGSPWGSDMTRHRLPRYHGADYVCCQRTMVDWICTFAYPFLSSPKVTVHLTGTVKKDTKDKWEAIFNGNRTHDQTVAVAAILNTPKDLLYVYSQQRKFVYFR